MKLFYEPTAEHLAKLDGPWNSAYSGGKDSTSMTGWIEYLRRTDWITAERPRLVMSNTTIEEPDLQSNIDRYLDLMDRSGWDCSVVTPEIHEKLYNRILGIGNQPIHPGIRNFRWCTRSTKTDPMDRWRIDNPSGLTLIGLRWGESAMRDGKLMKRGCEAGGECGIPDPDERTYAPILEWKTCQVIDWLSGHVDKNVRKVIADILKVTKQLVEVYEVKWGQSGFEFHEQEIDTARFGCRGCPAIEVGPDAPRSVVSRNGKDSPLNEIYSVWHLARLPKSRLMRVDDDGNVTYGPIKMAVRWHLFALIMDIQRRAGVVLITPEDEAFIRQCWENKVYPRCWSEADELTEEPLPPLYV